VAEDVAPACEGNTQELEGSKMWNEFKTFIMRGNVMDMAVGIIIGAAFASIVSSLVDDVLMPPIGLLLGGVDFSNLFLTLQDGVPGGSYAIAGSGAGSWCRDHQLRRLHQRRRDLPHRRPCRSSCLSAG
jgi:hypothetical protein